MSYGVIPTGFGIKSLDTIFDNIASRLKANIGPWLATAANSFVGQIIGAVARSLYEVWELGQASYAATDPEQATGAQLDNICALTGTKRLAAAKSTGDLYCCGDVATVVSAGSKIITEITRARAVVQEDTTLAAATAWQASTEYEAGDIVTGSDFIWKCTQEGTSSDTEPDGVLGDTFTDGSALWLCIGEGTAYALVSYKAALSGPVAFPAETLTEIETPLDGWLSAFNEEDESVRGTSIESDADLRVRRGIELSSGGSTSAAAVRNKLALLKGVTHAKVLENDDDVVVDGMAPHSLEPIVLGGDNELIATTILTNKAGGIGTNGDVEIEVTDSQGESHIVKFRRPELVDIYVGLNITYNPDAYPTDGDDQIKTKILEYAATQYMPGKDVIASALIPKVFAVSGVVACAMPLIGTSDSPTESTTIEITVRQLADLSDSRITIAKTVGADE